MSNDAESDDGPMHLDEPDLVAALQQGDRQAFREAVVRFSPQMRAVARRIVGPDRADDVVQEAWLTAYRKISDFQQRSTLSTWLQRIVTNRAISELRREGRQPSQHPATAEPAPRCCGGTLAGLVRLHGPLVDTHESVGIQLAR
ncbi:MAG: sigma-70 family RNA polymerase sigma factor [Gemmatimonadales bacterium]